VIEGLKVTVNGVELRLICHKRAKYHQERAAKYAEQIESMKEGQIEGMAYTNGDPIRSLQDRLVQHEAEESEMRFIEDHIALNESYLLGKEDLVKLGITKSRY
jgi:hypothetical protein